MTDALIKDPTQMPSMDDETLARVYLETCQLEEEMVSQKVAIRAEFLARLTERKKDGVMPGGKYTVTKFSKVTFKTSLEDAKKLGATRTEEKVDPKLLRVIYDAGTKVPGVEIREEVRIGEVKKA